MLYCSMEIKLAETMALELMAHYGLGGWIFGFDNAVSRLGYCNYTKRRISLGRHSTMVNPETEVKNTILHEIAHALVGPGFGHGPVWKAKARSIGCTAERTGKIEVKAAAKYEVTCTLCSHVYSYYRRPKWIHRLDSIWCTRCGRSSLGKLVLKVAEEVGIAFTNLKTLDTVTVI